MNIEKRGDRLYQVVNLHKWFAISSLLLFLFTVGMVFVDYAREWKAYQRTFTRMQVDKNNQDIAKVSSTFDRAKFAQLSDQIKQGEAQMAQHEADIKAA